MNLEGLNKSTIFLLPVVQDKLTYKLVGQHLINTYIKGIEQYSYLEYPLFVHLKFSETPQYEKLDSLLSNSPMFIGEIHVSPTEVIYAFNLPEDNYRLFLNGSYSLFNLEHKQRVLNFFSTKFPTPDNQLYLIFRKQDYLRHCLQKQLGCNRKLCKCPIDPVTTEHRDKKGLLVDRTFSVEKNPMYLRCRYFSGVSIPEDAELFGVYEEEEETYVKQEIYDESRYKK